MKKSKTRKELIKFIPPVGLFVIVTAIYIYNLCPSLYPGDSVDTITAAATLGIPHPPGYPLFTMLGHLFSKIPLMDIPWRINLMSAIFSSLTIVVIYLIINKLTKNIFASLAGSLLLAFSFQYFTQSLYADFLSLSLLLNSIEIFILLYWYQKPQKKYLYLFALVAGLNLSSHQTSEFILPAALYLIYVKNKKFFLSWDLLKSFGFFVTGLLPYIYLPIRAHQGAAYVWGNPNTISGFFDVISRKEYGGNDFSFFGYFYARLWDYILNLSWQQFYLIGFIVGIYGFFRLKKENQTLFYFFLLMTIFTGFIFAFIANVSSDKDSLIYLERFFVISGSFFAIIIGVGAAKISEETKLPSFLLLIVPLIFLYFNSPRVTKRHYYYAIDYANNIIQNLPQNSFVFAVNDTPTFEIWYLQYVENKRKDLTVIPGGDSSTYSLMKTMEEKTRDYSHSIDEIARKRPVYTTTLTEIDWSKKMDNFEPEGLIYRYSIKNDWLGSHEGFEIKKYFESYNLRGIYSTQKVRDYKTQTIIRAYASAWIEEGIIFNKQNNLIESTKSYLKALEIDPKNEVALTNYAGNLSTAGKFDEAIEVYDFILKKINPKSEFARKGLEKTLERKSNK